MIINTTDLNLGLLLAAGMFEIFWNLMASVIFCDSELTAGVEC